MSLRSCLLALLAASSVSAQTVETVLSGPEAFDDALSLDAQGRLYGSYYYGQRITRILPDGSTELFLDGLGNPNGTAFDPEGRLLVAEAGGDRVLRVTQEGVSETLIEGLNNPAGVLPLADGSLLIARYSNNRVDILYAEEEETELWLSHPSMSGPVGLKADTEGNVYIGCFNNGKVLKRDSEGEVTEIGDVPGYLGFLEIVGDFVYATAFQEHQIYRMALDGSGQEVWAGSGSSGQIDGPLAEARFDGPNGILASASGDTLWITDHNSRALRRIVGVLEGTGLSQGPERPSFFELGAPYPNPFNPRALLPLQLHREATVRLALFDLRGARVGSEAVFRLGAGEHLLPLEAQDLASGAYFLRLQAGDDQASRRITLLR